MTDEATKDLSSLARQCELGVPAAWRVIIEHARGLGKNCGRAGVACVAQRHPAWAGGAFIRANRVPVVPPCTVTAAEVAEVSPLSTRR